jgi:signal transduction histidine kinase
MPSRPAPQPCDARLRLPILYSGVDDAVRLERQAPMQDQSPALLLRRNGTNPWQQQAQGLLLAAEELNAASDPEQILLRVVAIAARLLSVERVAIATNEGDHALRRYTWDDDIWRASSARLPLDRSISGRVIRNGQAYRSADLSADELFDGDYRYKTLLAVPILARDGRVLGSLNLHERRDGSPFSDDDQRLAEAIAHHAAVALERARMIEAIRAHVGALEEKTREQDAFLHTVSHALKTPLTSILAMAEMLQEDATGQEESTRHGITLIHRNARRLRTILDDLLGLARATAGLENLEMTPVDLNSVMETVSIELSSHLRSRNVVLSIESPLPCVIGHEGRLAEAFTNLIDNAIKYTPADRQPLIEIGARLEAGIVDCWVADNGIGIPPELREDAFELFRRLETAKHLETAGSGVGLAVVRRIVERHGGKVWIEDNPAGGCRFRLTIPAYFVGDFADLRGQNGVRAARRASMVSR